MVVYIVISEIAYEGDYIIDVYNSRESAIEHAKRIAQEEGFKEDFDIEGNMIYRAFNYDGIRVDKYKVKE